MPDTTASLLRGHNIMVWLHSKEYDHHWQGSIRKLPVSSTANRTITISRHALSSGKPCQGATRNLLPLRVITHATMRRCHLKHHERDSQTMSPICIELASNVQLGRWNFAPKSCVSSIVLMKDSCQECPHILQKCRTKDRSEGTATRFGQVRLISSTDIDK